MNVMQQHFNYNCPVFSSLENSQMSDHAAFAVTLKKMTHLSMKDDAMMEGFFRVQRNPGIVIVILD